MVKIKDFTLALQNLGGGHVPPVPYTPGAHDHYSSTKKSKILYKFLNSILNPSNFKEDIHILT